MGSNFLQGTVGEVSIMPTGNHRNLFTGFQETIPYDPCNFFLSQALPQVELFWLLSLAFCRYLLLF